MSTIDNRLRRLERSLSPLSIVLGWMVEAQRYPSLVAYARSTLDGPDPGESIPRQVRAATLKALWGHPKVDVDEALLAARNQALLAYELVFVLNAAALEFAKLASLRMALADELGHVLMLTAVPARASTGELDAGDEFPAVGRSWQAMASDLIDDLLVERSAHMNLVRELLAGHSPLFRDARAAWAELASGQRRLQERLREISASSPIAAGGSPSPSLSGRVQARMDELLDAAKLVAFARVGDGHLMARVAERRLRAVVEPGEDAGDLAPAPPISRGPAATDGDGQDPDTSRHPRHRPRRKVVKSRT